MKFEEPEESFVWPPKGMLSYVHLAGPKCFVRLIPTEDGLWWEMGGHLIEKHGSNADDSLEVDSDGNKDEDEYDDEALDDYVHINFLDNSFGIDKRQSRIYYRFNTRLQKHECRIILPRDFHFRSSRKGMIQKRSKSYMEDGMPRPEVLLLYALKTQELVDRRTAVEAFPEKIWNAQNLEELFGAMDEASMNHKNFCDFAGDRLSRAATRPGGLADWAVWEKVADAAVAVKKDKTLNVANLNNQHTHVQLLRALEKAVVENRGIPSQAHVRSICKWDYDDFWKDLLKTMGMTWLPGEVVWKNFQKWL